MVFERKEFSVNSCEALFLQQLANQCVEGMDANYVVKTNGVTISPCARGYLNALRREYVKGERGAVGRFLRHLRDEDGNRPTGGALDLIDDMENKVRQETRRGKAATIACIDLLRDVSRQYAWIWAGCYMEKNGDLVLYADRRRGRGRAMAAGNRKLKKGKVKKGKVKKGKAKKGKAKKGGKGKSDVKKRPDHAGQQRAAEEVEVSKVDGEHEEANPSVSE